MLFRVGVVLALWLSFAGVAHADVIEVTRTDDRPSGACGTDGCTLREALTAAQAGDTVQLGGTATGARVHDVTQGQLIVDRDVTIAGNGADVSGIDGSFNPHRILRVSAGAQVTVRDLSFSGGHTAFEGPDPLAVDGGHAIFNAGQLTVQRVVFESNGNSSSTGGAIGNRGTLLVSEVDFHANRAHYGGAVFSHSGSVTLERSSVRGGSANGGGSIYVRGGTMAITNTTVVGNGDFGPVGGVINAGGAVSLLNVTLAGNVNGSLRTDPGATTAARNTIFARGYGAICVVNAVTDDEGGNVAEDLSCVAGQPVEARLAGIADNGGASPTAALLVGSAAIDAPLVTGCPATDQRGVPRSGLCDVGAFEAVKLAAPTAVTLEATDTTFVGTADVQGEGGALWFEYGPVGGDFERTTGVGLGAPTGAVTRSEAFPPLQPGTTYQYRAVAANATGLAFGDVRTMTTPAPPSILDLDALDVSDDSITLRFVVDPAGAGGGYELIVDGASAPMTPLPGSGRQEITRTVTGLKPEADHRLQVVVTGPGGKTAIDDGIIDRRTLRRATGTAGAALTVDCGSGANVDWGDGTSSTSPCVHTYAAGGRYRVKFDGNDELVAVIAPAAGKRLLSVRVAGRGRVTGNGIDCPSVCNVELAADAAVALTATPGAGEQFAGWGDHCNGTGACEFTLSEHRNVVADFSGTIAAPSVGELHVAERTDTTARLQFLIGAGGAPTTYTVVVDGEPLAPVSIGSSMDTQVRTHDLAGLEPGRRYDVEVIARNAAGEASDVLSVKTASRVTGVVGGPVQLVMTGRADSCPGDAQIAWGDGAITPHRVDCIDVVGGYDYRVEATHTYARADRFRVDIVYAAGEPDAAYALVAGARQRTLTVSVTGSGRVTGGGIDCPGTCSVTADEGTVVPLTATPGQGQRFGGWNGCAAPCAVTLDADRAVSAAFEAEPVITPDASVTPTPSPSPSPDATPAPLPAPLPTATPAPAPQPTPAVDVVAAPAGGVVLVKLPGTNTFVALRPGQALPYGTEIDTRKGRVTLSAIPKPGAPAESAVFYDGLFKISYAGGITNLTLTEPLAACPKKGRASASAKKAKSRKLWGNGKGSFRTSGKHSAATVRGTTWMVQDSCAGTLTRVTQGAVTVKAGKKTVVVRAGKQYLAKPR